MQYTKTYLVIRNNDNPIIVKVDQYEKVNRPNGIDDEEWITEFIENEYGGFNKLQITDIEDIEYKYLHFEDFKMD